MTWPMDGRPRIDALSKPICVPPVRAGVSRRKAQRAFADRGEVFSLDDETFARTREDALPDIYLIALERAVQDRLEDGYTLVRIAADLKVGSYETLNRRRKEAKRRNLGPTS